MALALKGEVALPRAGGDLTLLFDMYALAVAEEELKMSPKQIAVRMSGIWGLKFTGVLFWAALREHHPEFDVKTCIRMLGELTVAAVEDALTASLRAALPSTEEEAKAPDDPPLETAGAGGTG